MADDSEELKLFRNAEAAVAHLPYHNGDGYSYGGGVILVIGPRAIYMGDDRNAEKFANEIALRWNSAALKDTSNEQ